MKRKYEHLNIYDFMGVIIFHQNWRRTILSITSGNWEDPTTWNLNRAPLTTDNAVINNNHNVTITTDGANSNKAEVRPNSKLIYGNSAAKLKVGF